MKNKKFTIVVVIAAVLVIVIAAVMIVNMPDKTEEEAPVRIASLKGPTSIGMVKLMDDYAESEQYEFSIYAAASEISPLLINGSVDIANIPANLAATLYAKTNGEICVLNTNTLGVLYMVGMDSGIDSFEDAKGKTVYSTGKGTTPEYILNYLLEANGFHVDDFEIEYKSEATEVVAALQADPSAVAVLPQPFVLTAQAQIENLEILLDFNEEWGAVSEGSQLVTGVTVVRKAFMEEHPQAVEAFMEAYESSITYVNENSAEMAVSVEKYDIVKAAIAQKAIPYCNLTYMDGAELKEAVSGYLEVLFEQDPAAVGGALPDDAFYYVRN